MIIPTWVTGSTASSQAVKTAKASGPKRRIHALFIIDTADCGCSRKADIRCGLKRVCVIERERERERDGRKDRRLSEKFDGDKSDLRRL
jgi:hypothetical protein